MNFDLECRDVTKVFGTTHAVDGVSLQVPAGSFFSILGPSGCGKTTLLRMIAGFGEPTSGDILIKGSSVVRVPPNKRPVNMVFQHLALFPMMNVAENIAYGLRRRRMPAADIKRKVADVLARVGLPDAGPKRIDQLSGGQKQRIAIARCMVLDPAVLLLDEPLGALDLKLREHMKIELKQLQSQFGTTFVYITHDQSEALVMSDRVAVMSEGRFQQVGTPQELYYNPQTGFVAGFVGDSNRWRGRVRSANGRYLTVGVESGGELIGVAGTAIPAGSDVDVFVRPESIALNGASVAQTDSANRATGVLESLLFNGANSRGLVRLPNGMLMSAALPQAQDQGAFSEGTSVALSFAPDRCLVFPAGAPAA